MKYFISLAIFISSISLSGQNSCPTFDTLVLKPSKGLTEYYEYVRLAENALVRNDTIQTIKYYMEAFKYKKPFTRDYLNAKFLYNNKPIVDSLILITLYRFSRSISEKDRNYDEFLDELVGKHPELNTSFVNAWKKDRTIQKFTINNQLDTTLIKEINAMLDAEQKPRLNGGKFTNIDSLNLFRIINMYKEHGDLTEQKLGNAMQWINLMLFHITRYKLPEWIPLISEQVMKGNFPNKWFAELLDSYIRWNVSPAKDSTCFYYNSGFPLADKYLILNETDRSFIDNVNQRRSRVLLDSWQEQQQKQLWNFRHGYTIFLYSFFAYGNSILPESTPEEIEQTLKEQEKFIENFKKKNGDNYVVFLKGTDDYDVSKVLK